MASVNGFEHRHRSRKVKSEHGRTVIEEVNQRSTIYAQQDGRAGTLTATDENVTFICARCSGETDIHDCIWLFGQTYHRLPCGLHAVESIIDQHNKNPGAFSPTILARIYLLHETLRSERRRALVRSAIRFLIGN